MAQEIRGHCTNSNPSPTYLNAKGVDFIKEYASVGRVIYNLTDGSTATINAVIGGGDNDTVLTTMLVGGTNNLWNYGDEFKVSDYLVDISVNLDIYYSVGGSIDCAMRVIKQGIHARDRQAFIHYHGIPALYKNMWEAEDNDEFHGAGNVEQGGTFEYRVGTTGIDIDNMEDYVTNTGILYGPTQKVRVAYMRPMEKVEQERYGIVTRGTAVIGAALNYPWRRGDIFKIHDKTWMVVGVPDFEYWRNLQIIGYRLDLVAIKYSSLEW